MLPDPYLRFRDEFIALDPARYPAEYIDGQVSSGTWRCWGSERAAIIAEIREYPSGLKEVHGIAAAGDLREIVGLIPHAEEYGRKAGCRWASIESHPAWVRLLPDYEPSQLRIVKQL